MRKFFNFVGFSCLNVCLCLYNKVAYAQGNFIESAAQTMYGTRFSVGIRPLTYLTLIVVIFSLGFSMIVSFIKNKFKKEKFDYENEYQKFKAKDKVKITFMKDNEENTKKVRIISINEEGISFESKGIVHQCTPSEVKDIKRKTKRLLVLIGALIILALLTVIDFVVLYTIIKDDGRADSEVNWEGLIE